jgi:hypothetical protein
VDTEAVTLWFALLAVVAEIGAVAIVVLHLLGRRDVLRAWIGPHALGFAFVVALVAMSGSLYLSEGAHFAPCRLCWYQRIAMYPLVPILAVAALRRDWAVRPYAMVLAALGAVVSTYHVLVERFPSLESGACEPLNPCTIRWVEHFGYLTIPVMALSGFVFILALLSVPRGSPT